MIRNAELVDRLITEGRAPVAVAQLTGNTMKGRSYPTAAFWAHVTPTVPARPADRWWESAACRDHQHLNWFPGEFNGRTTPADPDGWRVCRLRAICVACPVRGDCLADAIARHEQHGFYGGMTTTERGAYVRRIKRRRVP